MGKKRILFYCLGVLAIIVLIFLILSLVPRGINTEYNLNRIDGISKEIMLKGISGAPYQIYSSALNGYGSASPLFYCDLFLYIPALLVYWGIKIQFTYKIFLVLVVVLSGINMFFAVKKVFKNKLISIGSSITYMILVFLIIEYLTIKIYSDFSFFVFIPLVFAGIMGILFGEKNKRDVISMAIGMSGLAFSQIIIADIAGVIVVIVFVISFKKWIQEKYKLMYLILSFLFMFGMSSFYTLPLLEQLSQPNISWGNVFPTEFEGEDFQVKRGEILISNNEKLKTYFNRTRYAFDFKYRKNKEYDTFIELPLTMYKGYAAVDKNTNRQYEVQVSEDGLVQVNVYEIYQGDVTVFYRGTEIQNYSVFVTTISFMVMLGFKYWKKEDEKC